MAGTLSLKDYDLKAPCGCKYYLETGVYGSRGEGPVSLVKATPYEWQRCKKHQHYETLHLSILIANKEV